MRRFSGPDTIKTFRPHVTYNPGHDVGKVTDDDWPEDEEGAEAGQTASNE
jgi:hypothetical protein